MTTLRDVIHKKGSEVFSIQPDASVFEALKLMADKNTGAILVRSGNHVEGILSERDCACRVDLHGRTARVKDFFRVQLAVNGRVDPQSVVYRVIGSVLYLIFFSAFTFSEFHLLALSLVAAGIDAGHFNTPMGAGTLTAL